MLMTCPNVKAAHNNNSSSSVYSFAPTLVASPRWVKRPLGQTTRRRLLLPLLLLLSRAALTAGQVIST